MRRETVPAGIAICGGAVGFLLRWWQLRAGFEGDTGLAVRGHPSAVVLAVWVAVVAVVILFSCRNREWAYPYKTAFQGGAENTLYMTAVVIATFLLLGSAAVELMNYPALSAEAGGVWLAGLLPPLRVGMSVLGGGCMLAMGRDIYRSLGHGKENLGTVGICLFYCLWMISFYQEWSSEPVVQKYIYELLAVIAGMMGSYFIMDYSFQKGKPKWAIFACLMAVILSMVSLADGGELAGVFRHLASVFFYAAHGTLLLQRYPDAEVEEEEGEEGEEGAGDAAGEEEKEYSAGEAPAETEVKDHG